MIYDTNHTHISNLSLRGKTHDPLVARQRLTHLLSTTDLAPAGLPATAVIFIRRLHDPLPGRMSLLKSQDRLPRAWQHAVESSIDSIIRQAFRPARGFVPEGSQAIWFDTYSELLACLATDWRNGSISQHWWWRSLLRNQDSTSLVISECLDHPEYIPAAMQQLSGTDVLHRFVTSLKQDTVLILLARIIDRYALAPIQSLLESLQNESTKANQVNSQSPRLDKTKAAISDNSNLRLFNPWLKWVPETDSDVLSMTEKNLIGVCLLIYRKPNMIRSSKWIERMHNAIISYSISQTAERAFHDAGPEAINTQDANSKTESINNQKNLAHQNLSNIKQTDLEADAKNVIPGRPVIRNRNMDNININIGTPIDFIDSGAKNENDNLPEDSLYTKSPQKLSQDDQNKQSTHITETHDSVQEGHDVEAITRLETQYGGALFLINIGLFLELYADFSRPVTPGIELPIWDFVALLAKQLVGDAVMQDPLWECLAQLSGRDENELPAIDYTAPSEWRMPQAWLTAIPEDTHWYWQVQQDRLQIHHPAGFKVLDISLAGREPLAVLNSEVESYRNVNLCQTLSKNTADHSAVQGNQKPYDWFACLYQYVRARLCFAMGMPKESNPGLLLCAYPAEVQLTDNQLDAYFELNDLPVQVRISGVDRDPGWVPAAGRYIRFHFG